MSHLPSPPTDKPISFPSPPSKNWGEDVRRLVTLLNDSYEEIKSMRKCLYPTDAERREMMSTYRELLTLNREAGKALEVMGLRPQRGGRTRKR